MRRRLLWFVMLGMNLAPVRANAQGQVQEFRQVAMGMEVRVSLVPGATAFTTEGTEGLGTVADAVFRRIEELEWVFSDWMRESEVRRLRAAPVGQWVTVSRPLFEMTAFSLRLAAMTDGAFDPTIGPLTALWREAARTGQPIDSAAREAARARVGYRAVEVDSETVALRFTGPGVQLDFGAVAKGWILDEGVAVAKARGVPAALIEAGGDIALYGAPPGQAGWRITVPRDEGDTTVMLTSGGVSSSGPEMQVVRTRDGGVESHVIQPATGRGLGDGLQVTVIGPQAAWTDALATIYTLVPDSTADRIAHAYGVRLMARRHVRLGGTAARPDNSATRPR